MTPRVFHSGERYRTGPNDIDVILSRTMFANNSFGKHPAALPHILNFELWDNAFGISGVPAQPTLEESMMPNERCLP